MNGVRLKEAILSPRWQMAILMFLCVAISYLDRVNISHAILKISSSIHLSPIDQGIVLSAFSFGYVLFMLPGGLLSDRFGSRVVLLITLLLLSGATLLNGIATSFASLVIIRFLVGVFEAPVFPANAKLVNDHFLKTETSKAVAFFDMGSYVGSALAAPLIILIIVSFGWRYAFYISGLLGFLWVAAWVAFFKKKGAQIEYINANSNSSLETKIGWFVLLKHRKIIGMCYGFFCYNYIKNFFLTWLPTYLVNEKGFTLIKVGFTALIPPLCAIIGEIVTGMLTDKAIKRGASVTVARKLPLCAGMMLSSIIIFATFTNSVIALIVILSLSYTFLISASVGIWSMPIDIAPSSTVVATIGGIQNTFSNIAGIIAPICTGMLFSITGSFFYPILVSVLLAISGALSYWFIVGKLTPLALHRGRDIEHH